MTGNPDVISSPVVLVPINALAVTVGSLARSRLPGTHPNVFCCPLLVQVSGARFSWLERLPAAQEVAGSSPVAPAKFRKSCCYFWQEIGIGCVNLLCFRSRVASRTRCNRVRKSDTVGSVSHWRLSRRG